jgi:hypothetical protein
LEFACTLSGFASCPTVSLGLMACYLRRQVATRSVRCTKGHTEKNPDRYQAQAGSKEQETDGFPAYCGHQGVFSGHSMNSGVGPVWRDHSLLYWPESMVSLRDCLSTQGCRDERARGGVCGCAHAAVSAVSSMRQLIEPDCCAELSIRHLGASNS